MSKTKFLKFKGGFYLKLISLISIIGFIVACAGSRKTNSTTNNGKDSIVPPKDSVVITKYGIPPNLYDEKEKPTKK